MELLDPQESARRLRAAIAYAGLDQSQAAKVLGVSVTQLARMIDRKGGELRPASWDQLWAMADTASLPREWFTADLERLYEIVPEGMPTFVTPLRQAAARERLGEALRERARQTHGHPDSTGEATPPPDAKEKPS